MNELFHDDLPPWDRGKLLAHQIAAGPTEGIEQSLEKARRQRGGFLTRFRPGLQRYLDGLITGLEKALEQRRREHRHSRKRRSNSKERD